MLAIVLGKVSDSPLLYCAAAVIAFAGIFAWWRGKEEDEEEFDLTQSNLFPDGIPVSPSEKAKEADWSPLDVADVLIVYGHDDRDRSVPSRDRPLLLKNVTPGKNALNVRVQPV